MSMNNSDFGKKGSRRTIRHRKLTVADPDNPTLGHISIAGGTYTILVTGAETAGRYCLIDVLVHSGGGPPPHRHDFEEMFTLLSQPGRRRLLGRCRRRLPMDGASQIDLTSPPSMRSVEPVIQRAPGDTRKRHQLGDLFRLAIARDAGLLREVGRCLLDRHVVQVRPVLEIRAAPAGHHRSRQDAVELQAS